MKNNFKTIIQGSLDLLEYKITKKYPKIDTSDLMIVMPKLTATMPPIYRSVFTGFYWRRMSISDLQKNHGLKDSEVESILDSATELFMTLYKESRKK